MLQVVSTLKNGKIDVVDVPAPILLAGSIRVRNLYSVISSGTEGATLKSAQKNYLGKALDKPEELKKVWKLLQKQGIRSTFEQVKKRLESYYPLGYSSVGRVLEVSDAVKDIAIGDYVACGGVGFACHAEEIVVPRKLCVKLDPHTKLDLAAYNTLGAIALQGVRQADLKLGEKAVVIGLGLIGQLTLQLLQASGVDVVGVDSNESRILFTRETTGILTFLPDSPELKTYLAEKTSGYGADAIIIAAATSSSQPINLAGELVRQKGKIVVVGDVSTDFHRETYYRKELELKMACSYGPGRYDPFYEIEGIDYPYAYVRWTENRNMAAFQDLILQNRIKLNHLTTQTFSITEAKEAYDYLKKPESVQMGLMFQYPEVPQESLPTTKMILNNERREGHLGVSFIGMGSYALGYLLPHLNQMKEVELVGVLSASGTKAKKFGKKYGFSYCTSDPKEILTQSETDLVFISTHHDSHFSYVKGALEANKAIYVDKPLCLDQQELDALTACYREREKAFLMVGYNRRFAPLTKELKSQLLQGVPSVITYRVNAGRAPEGESSLDNQDADSPVTGEICHFFDFLIAVLDSKPSSLSAQRLDAKGGKYSYLIQVKFVDGSIASVQYLKNGDEELPKEQIEINQGEQSFYLKDFRELKTAKKKIKSINQDKGQLQMLTTIIRSLRTTGRSPITFEDLYCVSKMTFAVISSINTNSVISLQD